MSKGIECPTCHRPFERQGMYCGSCNRPIKKKHRWNVIGSTVRHLDCKNPTMETLCEEKLGESPCVLLAEHMEKGIAHMTEHGVTWSAPMTKLMDFTEGILESPPCQDFAGRRHCSCQEMPGKARVLQCSPGDFPLGRGSTELYHRPSCPMSEESQIAAAENEGMPAND